MQTWIDMAFSAGLGIALGMWLASLALTRRDRRAAQARNTRGKRGEERALQLLEEAGYSIVERQRRSAYRVLTDGRELEVGVSFDFVVARDGRELIAEVKTGSLVTQLRHADTRRQLLEYQLISGCAPILLVDPDAERITEVSFPLATASASAPAPETELKPSTPSWLWGALLGLAVVLYVWVRG